MSKTKIYSPSQVTTISLLGGPGAMVFVLKKNFDSIGNRIGLEKVIIIGSLTSLSCYFLYLFFQSIFYLTLETSLCISLYPVMLGILLENTK
jgi:hypothetical protein